MPPAVWSTQGKVHVYLILLMTEMCEVGSTHTLYAHRILHFFRLSTSSYAHSSREGRGAGGMACSGQTICWVHKHGECGEYSGEFYVQFMRKLKKKRDCVDHWHP